MNEEEILKVFMSNEVHNLIALKRDIKGIKLSERYKLNLLNMIDTELNSEIKDIIHRLSQLVS